MEQINLEGKNLQIVIPPSTKSSDSASASPDSLFSSTSFDSLFDQAGSSRQEEMPPIALSATPPISGLYFDPTIRISQDLAASVVAFCQETYFRTPGANQVMLFGRAPSVTQGGTADLPPALLALLDILASVLQPVLPDATYTLLFPSPPTKARQAIINLYHPGEGITPHVDLLGRYADGIIGVSFGSGCVMRFDKVPLGAQSTDDALSERERWDLYLPERSVIVLSEEARYDWTHGIDKRTRDYVATGQDDDNQGHWVDRGVRISITFRWMLEGADVLR